MFTVGGLSGVVLANASLDIAFHDTGVLIPSFLIMAMTVPLLFSRHINDNNDANVIPDEPNSKPRRKHGIDQDHLQQF